MIAQEANVAGKKQDAVKTVKKAKVAKAQRAETPVLVAETLVADAVVAETKFDEGTKTMTDTVKTKTAEIAEKATEFFKGAQAKAQEAFAKSGETAKEVAGFHKANAEAVIESAKVAATGIQSAAKDSAALARKNFDATVAHAKALTEVRSPSDFLKMQGEFIRTQFDASVAEMGKASEFAVKFAGEVASPLQNRYAVVSEQVKARLAA